jgi:DNA (cytosine-5)-methyltransferase 1
MNYTRKIGSNRGTPRLWLEGSILQSNGFTHKTEYTSELKADGVLWIVAVTSTAPKGIKRVAGTPQRPIIDINSSKLLGSFGPVVNVTVCGTGWIVVTNHTEEA